MSSIDRLLKLAGFSDKSEKPEMEGKRIDRTDGSATLRQAGEVAAEMRERLGKQEPRGGEQLSGAD